MLHGGMHWHYSEQFLLTEQKTDHKRQIKKKMITIPIIITITNWPPHQQTVELFINIQQFCCLDALNAQDKFGSDWLFRPKEGLIIIKTMKF